MSPEEFLAAAIPSVRRFAVRRLRPDLVDDFVQDVAVKLLPLIPRFDPVRASPGTYAVGVARYAILIAWRRGRSRPPMVGIPDDPIPTPEIHDPIDLSRLSLLDPEDITLVRMMLACGIRGASLVLGVPVPTLARRIAGLRARMAGRSAG